MEADVRAAEAGIAVAYKERVPDFSLGLMADVKASPTLFRPLAGMTLPIWRDKLAAEVAQAQANELAAKSRLKAGQIDLAVSFAEKSFAYRETSRNVALIENELLSKARQSVETVRAGYRTGTMDFSAMTDAERMLLDLQLEVIQARTDREIALAELSLMVAGVPPANAPLIIKHHSTLIFYETENPSARPVRRRRQRVGDVVRDAATIVITSGCRSHRRRAQDSLLPKPDAPVDQIRQAGQMPDLRHESGAGL